MFEPVKIMFFYIYLEEKFVLQEDLSVSDRNDVGGNVSGHISGLGLNDGEGGEGASSALVGHLGCTFEKTGVEVEDVTGVGLKQVLILRINDKNNENLSSKF